MSEQRCKECRWWQRQQQMSGPSLVMLADVYGLCKRFPPQLAKDKFGMFPVTMDEDWCGEFTVIEKP